MSIIDETYVLKERKYRRTYSIENQLFIKLKEFSKIYDASIPDLLNACLEHFVETKNIVIYQKDEKETNLKYTFLIRENTLIAIENLKDKFGIGINTLVNMAIRNILMGKEKVSIFDKKFFLIENKIRKHFKIENLLLTKLEELSKIYDASVADLLNTCLKHLIQTENITVYQKDKNEIVVTHSFLVRESNLVGLENLRDRYGISIYRLVNIAIRNMINEHYKEQTL